MQSDLQIWQLIWQASLMVKGVMAILLVASLASWMIIFRKRQILSKSEKDAETFEERFWSGTDLTALHEGIMLTSLQCEDVYRTVEIIWCGRYNTSLMFLVVVCILGVIA